MTLRAVQEFAGLRPHRLFYVRPAKQPDRLQIQRPVWEGGLVFICACGPATSEGRLLVLSLNLLMHIRRHRQNQHSTLAQHLISRDSVGEGNLGPHEV